VVPPASARHCTTCDTAKVRIGSDFTEELDYVPVSFVIREYVRPKYACGRCQQDVVQAVLPARPTEKGRVPSRRDDRDQGYWRTGHLQVRGSFAVVSAGADLRTPRGTDHPTHALGVERGSGRLAGTDRARRTPGASEPVALIQCDDTTLDVQDPSRAPEIWTGHPWVYRGELGEVVYDFTWSRNRDGPLKMLANYRGYLQVDAAPAYDDVFAQHPDIIEVGCMAHARRYFKEALPTATVPCAQALAIIVQLYGIERAASDGHLDAPARQRLRQKQTRPMLEKLHAYL
jgi:transposase